MQLSVEPKRLIRSQRAHLFTAAALVSGVLAAGCGGSSPSHTVAAGGGTGTRASGDGGGAPAGASASPPNALEFARCMRSNGVPNFPDPKPGGGFVFSTSGVNLAAPAVKAARAKCQRFAPQPPGSGGSSFSTQEKAHALAQLRTVAACMRRHGVSDFPDPTSTRPPNLNPAVYSVITDYEGVFLLFPSTIDMRSPAWERAAAACGRLAESFNHPH